MFGPYVGHDLLIKVYGDAEQDPGSPPRFPCTGEDNTRPARSQNCSRLREAHVFLPLRLYCSYTMTDGSTVESSHTRYAQTIVAGLPLLLTAVFKQDLAGDLRNYSRRRPHDQPSARRPAHGHGR